MFGSSKKTMNNIGEVATLIGKDTIIKGNISGSGTLRIDGQVEGDINTTGNVMIGENGKVTAQCKAMNATVAGAVYGNMDITEKLELLATGQIYGDIKVGVLIIGEGATFKGSCIMRQGVEPVLMIANAKQVNKK